MKQIGEFAKENKVTIRALHHYEKLGLIVPIKTDAFTGYRYYDENQSNVLKTITYLKSLGFSLSEIKQIIISQMDEQVLKRHLYAKRSQALIDVNSTNIRYNRIVALLAAIDRQSQKTKFDLEEIINMNNKDVKTDMTEHELFQYKARGMYDNAIENNLPLCTMCIDIDRFKNVNDTFGHGVGDVVIERIKNVMINNSMELNNKNHENHSILERDAGDAFKIIVNDALEVCKKMAQNILEDVRNIDFEDIADNLSVTVSIGIASIENDKTSCSHLFHLADSALYDAKIKKRDRYLVYSK